MTHLIPENNSPTQVAAGDNNDDPSRCARAACLLRRLAFAGHLIVVGIAAAVLAGWALHIRPMSDVCAGFIPMAPSSASLFLVLSCGVILQLARRTRTARRLGLLAVFATIAVSATILLRVLVRSGPSPEPWSAPGAGTLVSIAAGRMSPLTACLFLGTAAALLPQFAMTPCRRRIRQAATGVTFAVLLVSLVVLWSYAAGIPLLYDGNTVPMALLTAVAFVMLGVAVLATAGWQTLCLSASGNATHSTPDRPEWFVRGPVATFMVLLLAIGAAGAFYVREQIQAARQRESDTIFAVADLKVRHILDWRKERRSDAETIMVNSFASRPIQAFLDGAADDDTRSKLRTWLRFVQEQNEGLRLLLLDPQLYVRLASPADDTYFGPVARSHAAAALRTGQVSISELHYSGYSGKIHLDVAIPLPAETGSPANQPIGVIVIEVDPYRTLYPTIQNWPTPSSTAETLLVRREGDEVVYLNELRHRTGTALALRARIDTNTQRAAVLAAQGHTGCIEAIDYRNVPVLAALRSIPGTSWFLVAKVDLAEFYAPLRAQAWTTGAIVIVLLVAAALGMSLLQGRHDERLLRARLVAEQERARAVESLQESETRFRDFFDKSPDAHLLLIDGVIADCNDATASMLRGTREQILGLRPEAISPERQPDGTLSREGAAARLWEATATGRGRFEWLHRRLDGSLFWAEIVLTVLHIRGQEGVFVSCRDVTDRKHAEQALQESEERFRSIAAAAHDGIVMMDPEGRISFWNQAAEAIFGYAAAEVLGRPLHPLLAPQRFSEAYRTAIAQFRVTGRGNAIGRTVELVAVRRNGEEFAVELSLSAAQLRGEWHAVGIIRDITERKRIENELRETGRFLEEATRRANDMAAQAQMANAAKSEFLANMSHEIRTPMTAILGYADLIAESLHCCAECPAHATCDIRSENQANLATIRRNGEHLLGLINDILDLSKIEARKIAAELSLCSPRQILAEVASLVSVRAASKGLQFDVECLGPIPESIRTDPLRLRQILVNLVGNAVKFTDTGGVRLLARLTEEDEPHLQFDVIDTGIGLEPDQVARIFQPFGQADGSTTRKYGGTGLGLVISKKLAQLLGGDVVLMDSRPGLGTRFRATVATGPLDGIRMVEGDLERVLTTLPPGTTQTESPPTPTAQPLRGIRVLLAEDGPDNQRLISVVLQKAGAEVAVAENGKLAMDMALSADVAARPYDVILMDMQMPVLDGYEATRSLRRRGYEGVIIALTAHAMTGDREKCVDAGCDAYASKPIDRHKLVALIAEHAQMPATA